MLTQHNIRAMSQYYAEVTLLRMSQLMNVDKDYCE